MELPYTKEKDIVSFLVLQESFTTEEIRGASQFVDSFLDGRTGQQPASDPPKKVCFLTIPSKGFCRLARKAIS